MKLTIVFAFLLLTGLGFADYTTQMTYNPFTNNFDMILETIEDFTIDNLIVTENAIIYGNLTVWEFITSVNVSDINANGSNIPIIDSTFSLGSNSLRWLNTYTDNLYATDAEIGNLTVSGNISIGEDIYPTTHTLGIYPDVAEGGVWTNLAMFGANASTYGRIMAVYGAVLGASEIIWMAHDGTNGKVVTGAGDLLLESDGGNVSFNDKDLNAIDCIYFKSGGKICDSS